MGSVIVAKNPGACFCFMTPEHGCSFQEAVANSFEKLVIYLVIVEASGSRNILEMLECKESLGFGAEGHRARRPKLVPQSRGTRSYRMSFLTSCKSQQFATCSAFYPTEVLAAYFWHLNCAFPDSHLIAAKPSSVNRPLKEFWQSKTAPANK